ncbi:MAG: urease accessory protein UreD [Actinomycetales bacterium]
MDEALVEVVSRGGRADVVLRTGMLSPRLLGVRGRRARVALVAATASLLGGDHCRFRVRVGAGCRLDLTDVAGTVAYDGRGARARWSVAVEAGPDAVLTWAGEPFVIAAGADVHRCGVVELAAGARVLLREQLVLGRHAEPPGRLVARTEATVAGEPLLVEEIAEPLPGGAGRPDGLSGTPRVLDSVLALGWRPPADPHAFVLAGPGAVRRILAQQAHAADLTAAWLRWMASLDAAPSGPAPM